MNISSYLEEALLNHVFRNTEYVRPATVYCGLVSDDAVDADMEGNDLTNEIDGYTGNRKPITFNEPSQVDGKATIYNNDGVGGGEIEFEDMPLSSVEYIIVTDSPTKGAGNILYWCAMDTVLNTNAGDTFRIPVDNLVLDLD